MSVAIVDGIFGNSHRKEIKTDRLTWSVQGNCFLFLHAISDGFYNVPCKPPVEVIEIILAKDGGVILVKNKDDADVLADWYEKQLVEVKNSYKTMR